MYLEGNGREYINVRSQIYHLERLGKHNYAVSLQPEVYCYRMGRKGDRYRWLCIWKETVVNI